jgi:glycine/D-amino acid oxidase-like deaminating enzyme
MIDELARWHGAARAEAIHREGRAALEWIEEFVRAEGINCDFQRKGRYHAAHTPKQFTALARRAEVQCREGMEAHIVPYAEQRSELGTDSYHGGVVYPHHAALHPAKYHSGLLELALTAGVQIVPHCPVLTIEKTGAGFGMQTPTGTVTARDVIVATNGYSGTLIPWLRRRIIPIGSYMIATEPLPSEIMNRLLPTDRIVSDTCRVVYYYRASPDRSRILFGGRVSARESDPKVSAPRLHSDLCRIFPELAGTRVSHSWSGTVAYSFDALAHCGVNDGIHYAASYCGSGVSMASYLGMRTGQRVLGLKEARTAFDDLPFPTRPFYFGTPWFLPTVVAWYRWRDQRECSRAAKEREVRHRTS